MDRSDRLMRVNRRPLAVLGAVSILVAAIALKLGRPDDGTATVAQVPGPPVAEQVHAGALPAPLVAEVHAEPLVTDQGLPADELERLRTELALHHEEQVRIDAAEALAEHVPGDGEAALLAAAAADESPRVREAALRALEGAASPPVIDAFAAALADTDAWVQDAGETGLYRHDDRSLAVRALVALCTSEDRELRIRAAELLDEMDAGPIEWDLIDAGPVQLAWAPTGPDDH